MNFIKYCIIASTLAGGILSSAMDQDQADHIASPREKALAKFQELFAENRELKACVELLKQQLQAEQEAHEQTRLELIFERLKNETFIR